MDRIRTPFRQWFCCWLSENWIHLFDSYMIKWTQFRDYQQRNHSTFYLWWSLYLNHLHRGCLYIDMTVFVEDFFALGLHAQWIWTPSECSVLRHIVIPSEFAGVFCGIMIQCCTLRRQLRSESQPPRRLYQHFWAWANYQDNYFLAMSRRSAVKV